MLCLLRVIRLCSSLMVVFGYVFCVVMILVLMVLLSSCGLVFVVVSSLLWW